MARPPELIDDATAEILVRLPADEPACLVRASLVCRSWRRLLTDPAFLRRYRELRGGAPPLLGFLHNVYDEGPSARFVATAAATRAFSALGSGSDRRRWWVLGCRHGRVLVHSFEPSPAKRLLVWDPITGDQRPVPVPPYPYYYRAATVLCAAAGCRHLDCHGVPFLVVFISAHEEEEDAMWASVYSSEAGAWTTSSSTEHHVYVEERSSLLAGDALYFSVQRGQRILKYDLVGRGLQLIDAPDMFAQTQTEGVIVNAEEGGLGLAGVKDGNLHLWSFQAGHGGNAKWVQSRVVELKTLFPALEPSASFDVVGFVEGTDTIFISTDAIAPYVSFYTPDLATARLPPP